MSETHYHFVSALRQGLAAAVTAVAEGPRAEIRVELHANARARSSGEWTDPPPVQHAVQLYGPGDVLGFDERIVVRTEPKADAGNFEPNYFPAIEFGDPDFVWRFTPDRGTDVGLTPWISLVVLIDEDSGDSVRREFDELPRRPGRVPTISVHRRSHLPELAHAWRWAHVQATTGSDAPGDAELAELLASRPERVVSRLLCPRRLIPGTRYAAFVVPTFRLGVAAALDEPPDPAVAATDLAWDAAAAEPIELPYYCRWTFRTSPRGDFEYLVRLLEARKLEALGLRKIDCERPGFGLTVVRDNVADPDEAHLLDMEGALQSLDTEYTRWGKDRNGPLPDEGSLPPMPEPEEFQLRLAGRVLNKASADLAQVELEYDLDDTPLTGLSFDALDDGRTVRVEWSTADATTGSIEYGEKDDAGVLIDPATVASNDAGARHRVELVLVPERLYHFRITVIDSDGAETTTPDATLRLPLPSVVPPIYGRWHAARTRVTADKDESGWVDWLNLDPRHRAAAGIGSEVVRRQQEALMASAWDQLGSIEAANDLLRRAQLGRDGSRLLHDRFDAMALEDALRVTAPVQRRIVRTGPDGVRRTIPAELRTHTTIAAAALDPGFRRIARPRGPLRRRQYDRRDPDAPTARPMDLLRRLARAEARAELRAAGPHPRPAGTPSACSVTEEMVRTHAADDGDDGAPTPGTPTVPGNDTPGDGTVGDGDGGLVSVRGAGDGDGGLVSVRGAGDGDGGVIPAPDPGDGDGGAIPIPIPGDPMRFCDDRLIAANLPDPLVDPPDQEAVAAAVRTVFETFLRPPRDADDEPADDAPDLAELRDRIHTALDPSTTIRDRTRRRFRLAGRAAGRFDEGYDGDPLDEIMAHPEFPQPMYEPLRDRSQDLVLPGVEKVPQNTIGLLETNGRFVESYMVGLNHELAGELLWRRYPTDQRGSYFRQFWDVGEYVGSDDLADPDKSELDDSGALKEEVIEALKDIAPLHEWGDTPLGRNDNKRANDKGERLVLVIRGDLLKRYPNAVIYAVDATDDGSLPKLPEFGGDVAEPDYPLFRGSLGADLTFLGFAFGEEEARSSDTHGGKFFVIEERVTEARFGLDAADASEAADVVPGDALHWGHFQLAEPEHSGEYLDDFEGTITVQSGEEQLVWDADASSAVRARVTLQKPVRVAVHADQMIP